MNYVLVCIVFFALYTLIIFCVSTVRTYLVIEFLFYVFSYKLTVLNVFILMCYYSFSNFENFIHENFVE